MLNRAQNAPATDVTLRTGQSAMLIALVAAFARLDGRDGPVPGLVEKASSRFSSLIWDVAVAIIAPSYT